MPLEFIGAIGTQEVSELIPPSGSVIDKDYLAALVKAHDASGFDRIIVAHSSSSVDGFQVASYALNQSGRCSKPGQDIRGPA
jgi:alkanesulfonate monooxygenase